MKLRGWISDFKMGVLLVPGSIGLIGVLNRHLEDVGGYKT